MHVSTYLLCTKSIHPPKIILVNYITNACIYRPCGSYDPLISPQQALPNPEWYQINSNFQNQNNKLYTCSSECSDHSLKTHSQHSHSGSQNGSLNGGVVANCQNNPSHGVNGKTKKNTCTEHCNGNNIYENEEDTERDNMISRCGFDVSEADPSNSECCSSKDGDTCCSCSESSCLYAEADDPALAAATHPTPSSVVKVAQN